MSKGRWPGTKKGKSGIHSALLSKISVSSANILVLIQVFGRVIQLAARKHAVAGTFFWMTAARTYEDYDGTTIYLTPPLKPCDDEQNLRIVESIRKHTIDINDLNSKSW